MIKIEKTAVMGWEAAIRGMRNPMNSWDKSDSYYDIDGFHIGEDDLKLMNQLCKSGPDHRKFMRMINVQVDVTAPLYWWKEYDTYKVGTVANSCSTMHRITAKEFTLDDFSHEHILDISGENGVGICPWKADGYYGEWACADVFGVVVDMLNEARQKFIDTKDKRYWWQIIQLLPSSYNQKRTCMMSYEALTNMYHARKSHKLDEWRIFCKWVESLPYAYLITGEEAHD